LPKNWVIYIYIYIVWRSLYALLSYKEHCLTENIIETNDALLFNNFLTINHTYACIIGAMNDNLWNTCFEEPL